MNYIKYLLETAIGEFTYAASLLITKPLMLPVTRSGALRDSRVKEPERTWLVVLVNKFAVGTPFTFEAFKSPIVIFLEYLTSPVIRSQ